MPSISNAYRGCRTPPAHPVIVAEAKKAEPRKIKRTGPARRFSEAEDAMLLKLRAEGLQWIVIAARMGRKPNSCLWRWRKITGRMA